MALTLGEVPCNKENLDITPVRNLYVVRTNV